MTNIFGVGIFTYSTWPEAKEGLASRASLNIPDPLTTTDHALGRGAEQIKRVQGGRAT